MKLKCNFKYSCSASNQSLDSESAREASLSAFNAPNVSTILA